MGNRRIPPEAHRALVPRKQSQAAAKAPAAQTQLARLSQGGKTISDAIPVPLKMASRHSLRFCGRAAAVLGLVILAGIAAVYARLMAGPVSFSFLVPTLERQLNSQIQGYSLRVGD